ELTPMRASVHALAPLGVAVAIAAGCGGGQDASSPGPGPLRPAGPDRFPTANAATLSDLRGDAPEGPVLAPTASLMKPGNDRFSFTLLDPARTPLPGAPG